METTYHFACTCGHRETREGEEYVVCPQCHKLVQITVGRPWEAAAYCLAGTTRESTRDIEREMRDKLNWL